MRSPVPKFPPRETFGEVGVEQMLSPMSFQRTDGDSVDSLLEPRPACNLEEEALPPDSAGFIPKRSK